jgi:hypothetical protein
MFYNKLLDLMQISFQVYVHMNHPLLENQWRYSPPALESRAGAFSHFPLPRLAFNGATAKNQLVLYVYRA